jgi:acyl carrier protein
MSVSQYQPQEVPVTANAIDLIANRELDTLLSELRGILSLDALDPTSPLIDIGVDSINIVEIMICCERIYGVSLFEGELVLDQYTTVRDIDSQLRKLN